MELSKAEKKIVREIIDKGIDREFSKGLSKADKILGEWKKQSTDNHSTYQLLYDHIMKFDKRIAKRYDGMTGSNYLLILAGQYAENIISESDLENVPEHIIQAIKLIASR